MLGRFSRKGGWHASEAMLNLNMIRIWLNHPQQVDTNTHASRLLEVHVAHRALRKSPLIQPEPEL